MMKKIIKITEIIVDVFVTFLIIGLGICLLIAFLVNGRYDDDNFYAFITIIVVLKLFDRIENNHNKIEKMRKEESKKES